MIKHPGFKFFNKFHFLGGILAAVAGIAFYKIYKLDYIILLWGIVATTQLVNSFISPDGYMVVGKNGIKKHYNEKLLRWEIIRKLGISDLELTFYYGKKQDRFYLDNRTSWQKVVNFLQENRKDVYERLFITWEIL